MFPLSEPTIVPVPPIGAEKLVPSEDTNSWKYLLAVFDCRRSKLSTMFLKPAVLVTNCEPAVPLPAVAAGKLDKFDPLFGVAASPGLPVAEVAEAPPIVLAVPVPVLAAVRLLLKFHCVTHAAVRNYRDKVKNAKQSAANRKTHGSLLFESGSEVRALHNVMLGPLSFASSVAVIICKRLRRVKYHRRELTMPS